MRYIRITCILNAYGLVQLYRMGSYIHGKQKIFVQSFLFQQTSFDALQHTRTCIVMFSALVCCCCASSFSLQMYYFYCVFSLKFVSTKLSLFFDVVFFLLSTVTAHVVNSFW